MYMYVWYTYSVRLAKSLFCFAALIFVLFLYYFLGFLNIGFKRIYCILGF